MFLKIFKFEAFFSKRKQVLKIFIIIEIKFNIPYKNKYLLKI